MVRSPLSNHDLCELAQKAADSFRRKAVNAASEEIRESYERCAIAADSLAQKFSHLDQCTAFESLAILANHSEMEVFREEMTFRNGLGGIGN
ncbi:TPA: hypothetical protein QDZ84_003442 [Shewanella algae]|uniref:hypothetical protein n=1 Tax=Shewanella TaxID=22 RepID=UPI00142F665C|nr:MULTISPECIES: hypothetical protein [Shewanella]NJI86988.1 hypothetical protein [Shewanella sp. Iso12]HDS1208403.1 hypothetical protein [Shewanella algae]